MPFLRQPACLIFGDLRSAPISIGSRNKRSHEVLTPLGKIDTSRSAGPTPTRNPSVSVSLRSRRIFKASLFVDSAAHSNRPIEQHARQYRLDGGQPLGVPKASSPPARNQLIRKGLVTPGKLHGGNCPVGSNPSPFFPIVEMSCKGSSRARPPLSPEGIPTDGTHLDDSQRQQKTLRMGSGQ